MNPLIALQVGKSLWDLYEEISEEFENNTSTKQSEDRNSNDLDSIKGWKYFDRKEFDCPCCGRNEISSELVNRIDFARSKAGIPFRISSGFRCVNRNRAIKGKKRSAHLKGLACDIKAPTSSIKHTILGSLFSAGIMRLGIYKTFIHADISTKLPHPVIF